MPRRQPPAGCITATEAIQRIGKSLYKYVEKNELHPQGPSTLKHKFYLESEIARIETIERRYFDQTFKDTQGKNIAASFAPAHPDDMEGLYQLALRLFGGQTIGPERRSEWIEKEPRGHYVMKRDDTHEVVAYLYLLSLSRERMLQYMKECRAGNITGADIQPLTLGTSHEIAIAGIGRDPRAAKQYTGALLHGFAQDLEQWGKAGIEISRFYAYSETLDGVYLCMSLGMKQWKQPRFRGGSPCFKFVLDVAESELPLLQPYKRELAEWQRAHGLISTRSHAQQTPYKIGTNKPLIIHESPSASREPRQASISQGSVPAGYVALADFLHGMSRSTAKRNADLTEGDWRDASGHVVNKLLSPAQQRAYWQWAHNRLGFVACPECPHDT